MGDGNVKSIEICFDSKDEDYFGYTFIRFHVESFDLTADFTGVIDSTGNWYTEPAIRHYDYGGNGLYKYYVPNGYGLADESTWYLYNLFTNEMAIGHEKWEEWSNNYLLNQHNELLFRWDDYYTDASGFYNANNNKVIDLAKYNLITYVAEPEFNEGYSLLEIENEQGSRYYTIIDITGTEMFSPQKNVEHGELRCGYYWVEDVGYMNVNGEVAFDIELQSGSDFNENMAVVRTLNSNIHYINSNGEIVY